MLIDSHCHIDRYSTPEKVVRDAGAAKICVVAVTNLPSHFVIARDRLRSSAYVKPALGMHPLHAASGIRELALFRRLATQADLIGEIGLDFSPEGLAQKAIQERLFDEVLSAISDRPRFITLHSRGAANAVVRALQRHGIRRAVFHWFTGSREELQAAVEAGHGVSINPAMLRTASGMRILEAAPPEAILVESDGPFVQYESRAIRPSDVAVVYCALSERWKVSVPEAIDIVKVNSSRYGLKFPNVDQVI
jgi:Mg-dependent DNase